MQRGEQPRIGPETLAIINAIKDLGKTVGNLQKPIDPIAISDSRDGAVAANEIIELADRGVFVSGYILNRGTAVLTTRVDLWTGPIPARRSIDLRSEETLIFNSAPINRIVFITSGTITGIFISYQAPKHEIGVVLASTQIYTTRRQAKITPPVSSFDPTVNPAIMVNAVMAAAQEQGTLSNVNAWRNNTEVTILASAARTASLNTSDQTNWNATGIYITQNITAVSGTSPTLDTIIQMSDPLSTNYIRITAFTQKTATGIDTILIYPGAVETAAEAGYVTQGVPLARTWRLAITIGGTTPSFTFSVGVNYVL